MCFKITQLLAVIALAIPVMAHIAVVTKREAWSEKVLVAHNQARASYGAKPLSWNNELYAATLQYAQKCIFEHSGGDYGENLYADSDPTSGVVDGVNAWMAEAADYNYAQPGFSEAAGHFTQVVWKGTTQVSCALAQCAAGTIFPSYASNYLVCRYTPPGNVEGEFPENVGRHV